MIIKISHLYLMCLLTFAAGSMHATQLADDIIAMINNHDSMTDQEMVMLASRIIEVSVPKSIKPFDPLTKEQADTAAELFYRKSQSLEKHACTGCNITPSVDTDPFAIAVGILTDYAHPEYYYR